jgi:hypothetical protein
LAAELPAMITLNGYKGELFISYGLLVTSTDFRVTPRYFDDSLS